MREVTGRRGEAAALLVVALLSSHFVSVCHEENRHTVAGIVKGTCVVACKQTMFRGTGQTCRSLNLIMSERPPL